MRFRSALAAVVVLATLALVTGCGGGGSSTSSSSSQADTSEASTGSSATKTPAIKVGFFNPGVGSGYIDPYASQAAEAAVEYVNNELGGVDGHPLEIEVCNAENTPESQASCGQKLFAAKPTVVTGTQFVYPTGLYQAQ